MIESDTTALRNLLDRARERTRASRERLFDNITDLFLSSEQRLTEQQRSLMLEILATLVHEVEIRVRRDLAERLSELKDVPHDLIVAIANQEIEVARPMLIRSELLRDPDLIEIVKQRSQEHLLAVAMRGDLSEEVSDALVDRGDDNVIETLLKNRDAALSRRALNYLVAESQRVDRFQQPLLTRPDLPEHLAHRMFWWVSAALRKYIVDHFSVGAELIDDYLADSTVKAMAEPAPSSADAEAMALVERLEALDELNERFLVQSLRSGQIPAFLAGLARLARLDLRSVRRIVFDPSGEPLALACRAMKFDRQIFVTLFLLTRKASDRLMAPEQVKQVVDFFDHIDARRAELALRYWRADQEYLRALDALRDARPAEV